MLVAEKIHMPKRQLLKEWLKQINFKKGLLYEINFCQTFQNNQDFLKTKNKMFLFLHFYDKKIAKKCCIG